jgi:hypothetical protein
MESLVRQADERDVRGQVLVREQISEDEKRITMGSGACTLCDCPSFVASGAGSICANQNSQGGTCNHWDYEHR